MQRTLIIMRHAKSSWAEPGTRDHDRALNDRGRRDAPRMGEWLGASDWDPDLVLVSSARRAQETFEGVIKGYKTSMDAETVNDIYGAEPDTLLGLAQAQTKPCVMMIGHNPGLEEVLRYLVPQRDLNVGHQKLVPTAAIYVVEFACDWYEVAAASGAVLAHARPRQLPNEVDD